MNRLLVSRNHHHYHQESYHKRLIINMKINKKKKIKQNFQISKKGMDHFLLHKIHQKTTIKTYMEINLKNQEKNQRLLIFFI